MTAKIKSVGIWKKEKFLWLSKLFQTNPRTKRYVRLDDSIRIQRIFPDWESQNSLNTITMAGNQKPPIRPIPIRLPKIWRGLPPPT